MLYIHFPEWLSPEIIPGLPIRWYGLMYLVAFATAYYLFRIQVRKDGLGHSDEEISNYFFWIILGLILGARLFSTLVYDTTGDYWCKPWLIFWPFRSGKFVGLQGMSYHGGLLGGILGGWLFCKKRKWPFLATTDRIMQAVPLGYTFGRLGNFINGELYGRVTASPLGIVFPGAETFSIREAWVSQMVEKIGIPIGPGGMVNLPRHPSQLYEAFSEGVLLWALLWFLPRSVKKWEGALTGLYLIGYGFFRFIIEYFRQPDEGLDFPLRWGQASPNYLMNSLFNFTTGQIFCFLMILGGGLLILFARWRSRRAAHA